MELQESSTLLIHTTRGHYWKVKIVPSERQNFLCVVKGPVFYLPQGLCNRVTPCITPGKLETFFPMTLATSLIENFFSFKREVQSFLRDDFLSEESLTDMSTEFIMTPRIVSSCKGKRFDFIG